MVDLRTVQTLPLSVMGMGLANAVTCRLFMVSVSIFSHCRFATQFVRAARAALLPLASLPESTFPLDSWGRFR